MRENERNSRKRLCAQHSNKFAIAYSFSDTLSLAAGCGWWNFLFRFFRESFCVYFSLFFREHWLLSFSPPLISSWLNNPKFKKKKTEHKTEQVSPAAPFYANRSLYFYFISKIFRVYALLIGVKKVSVNFSFTGRQFILYVSTSKDKSSRVIHTDGSEISRNLVLGSNRFQCCCWGNADLLKDMHNTHHQQVDICFCSLFF